MSLLLGTRVDGWVFSVAWGGDDVIPSVELELCGSLCGTMATNCVSRIASSSLRRLGSLGESDFASAGDCATCGLVLVAVASAPGPA